MKYATQQDRNEAIGNLKNSIEEYWTLVGEQQAILKAATANIQSELYGELSPEEMLDAIDKWSAVNNSQQAWDDILRPIRHKSREFDVENIIESIFNSDGVSGWHDDGKTITFKAADGTVTKVVKKMEAAEGTLKEISNSKETIALTQEAIRQIEKAKQIQSICISATEIIGGLVIFKEAERLEDNTPAKWMMKYVAKGIGIGLMIDGVIRQIK